MKRLIGIMIAMQILILATFWSNHPYGTPASAQIPDSGAQRNQVIEELKTLNGKIDKLVSLLESGKLKVKADIPEKDSK
jgi:hypothetical protein